MIEKSKQLQANLVKLGKKILNLRILQSKIKENKKQSKSKSKSKSKPKIDLY